ncbi:MAG: DNA polymerase Y family protein [Acetobacteraceae bacterium]
MRRVISVWLPEWPTDRLRRMGQGAPLNAVVQQTAPLNAVAQQSAPLNAALGEGAPLNAALVTARHDGRRRVIAAVDRAAAGLGLRPGMAVAQAVAVVPGLAIMEADPAADAASLERLARWCQRLTPLAATEGTDGLWLDVAGCAYLWGGERRLLDHLVARLAQDGVTARAAIADTPGAVHAVVRYGKAEMVVAPGAQAEAVAALPIEALRLPAEMVATLRRLGFEQVGALARIPRALLARRFGPEPGRRLDQMHGVLAEPLQPLAAEASLQQRTAFLEPLLTAEALTIAMTRLLEPLCRRMEGSGAGARRVDLLFERVDGTVQAIRIGTARPSRDARHLGRLLEEHLDTVDPGLGIEAMQVLVPLAETLRWRQEDTAGGADVTPLVDRLANRLGAGRVYRVAPVESDVPERAVRRVAALAQPGGGASGGGASGGGGSGGGAWSGMGPAPTRLLDPPQPVDAIAGLPDHAPAAFTWQRRWHRVRRADGPERVYGEWWRGEAETASVRDYFRVEDEEGRRFLLFRQGDGVDPATGGLSWFLQGVF